MTLVLTLQLTFFHPQDRDVRLRLRDAIAFHHPILGNAPLIRATIFWHVRLVKCAESVHAIAKMLNACQYNLSLAIGDEPVEVSSPLIQLKARDDCNDKSKYVSSIKLAMFYAWHTMHSRLIH